MKGKIRFLSQFDSCCGYPLTRPETLKFAFVKAFHKLSFDDVYFLVIVAVGLPDYIFSKLSEAHFICCF